MKLIDTNKYQFQSCPDTITSKWQHKPQFSVYSRTEPFYDHKPRQNGQVRGGKEQSDASGVVKWKAQ